MSILWDTYMLSAAGGFIYIVATAGFGLLNAQGDAATANGGGDAASADGGGDLATADGGGDFATADGGGDFATADGGGDFATADGGGDFATADGGGDFATADGGGDFATADARQVVAAGRTNLAHVRTATSHSRSRRFNLGLLILKLCSPTTVAMFGFSFGFAGMLMLKFVPALGTLSLLPATISGVIGYKVMCYLTNAVAEKLYANASYKTEQIIGHIGEITVPISAGRTGEIIYLAGKVRSTAPARGKTPDTACPTSSRVMITDVEDGVFIVEPYLDEALLS
jgi:hypothetical protein